MILRRFFSALQRRSSEHRHQAFTSATPTLIVPNPQLQGKLVENLVGHKAVSHKNGTVARNIINYFHYPADCHQENLDDGVLHLALSRVTNRILAASQSRLVALVHEQLALVLPQLFALGRRLTVVRLRDILLPVTTRIFYSLIFAAPGQGNAELPTKAVCSEDLVQLLSSNCLQVIKTIKGLEMPNLALRDRALRLLLAEVQRHGGLTHWFPDDLSPDIRAKHLQGVFFNSGSIQLAECSSHVLLALLGAGQRSRGTALPARLEESQMDAVLDETLRMFPLFGVTNRVAAEDIELADGRVIGKGTQIIIDFMQHHRSGYSDPESFQPERWQELKKSECNYMPFGAGARKCPAERFSRTVTKQLVLGINTACEVYSPTQHFRSLDGGGLAVLHRRSEATEAESPMPAWYFARLLWGMRSYVALRDAFEQVQFYSMKHRTFPRIVAAAQQYAHLRRGEPAVCRHAKEARE